MNRRSGAIYRSSSLLAYRAWHSNHRDQLSSSPVSVNSWRGVFNGRESMYFVKVMLATIRHPKLAWLRKEVGTDRWGATGCLIHLWCWAAEFATDGNLERWPNEAIEDGCGWSGEPGKLVSALIKCGFIDDNRTIHGWDDIYGDIVRSHKAGVERAKRSVARKLRANCAQPARNFREDCAIEYRDRDRDRDRVRDREGDTVASSSSARVGEDAEAEAVEAISGFLAFKRGYGLRPEQNETRKATEFIIQLKALPGVATPDGVIPRHLLVTRAVEHLRTQDFDKAKFKNIAYPIAIIRNTIDDWHLNGFCGGGESQNEQAAIDILTKALTEEKK